MTESEWLECADPMCMLKFLRGKASDRKLRLFVCSCCRTIWKLLKHRKGRKAIDVAERFADGATNGKHLSAANSDVDGIMDLDGNTELACGIAFYATTTPPDYVNVLQTLDRCAALQNAPWRAKLAAAADRDSYETILRSYPVTVSQEQERQCNLLHDIFGNQFHAVRFAQTWFTLTVTSLAQAAYDERSLPSGELDPVRLAILADALEEAGCDNADILTHLRGPGPHVRGCWVVDLLLGKS